MAAAALNARIPPFLTAANTTCAVIFHDRGERYLDTIYSDEWVAEHFGDTAHLWQDEAEPQTWMTATSWS
jgi:cysteine synthase A